MGVQKGEFIELKNEQAKHGKQELTTCGQRRLEGGARLDGRAYRPNPRGVRRPAPPMPRPRLQLKSAGCSGTSAGAADSLPVAGAPLSWEQRGL